MGYTEHTQLSVSPKAKALIFDIDGTLVDSMPVHYEAWRDTFKKYGHEYTKENFYEWAGIPTKETIDEFNLRNGTQLDAKKIGEEKEAYYMLTAKEKLKPIVPVVEIVKRTKGKLPMALGTGGSYHSSVLHIDVIGLTEYFEVMISSKDVVNHKPHPDTFLKAAEFMGIDPEFCQVFEDSDLGVEAAKRAGMIYTDIRPFIAC